MTTSQRSSLYKDLSSNLVSKDNFKCNFLNFLCQCNPQKALKKSHLPLRFSGATAEVFFIYIQVALYTQFVHVCRALLAVIVSTISSFSCFCIVAAGRVKEEDGWGTRVCSKEEIIRYFEEGSFCTVV